MSKSFRTLNTGQRAIIMVLTAFLTIAFFDKAASQETLEQKMARYTNFDINGDGIIEINYLRYASFEPPVTSVPRSNKLLLVFVESRLAPPPQASTSPSVSEVKKTELPRADRRTTVTRPQDIKVVKPTDRLLRYRIEPRMRISVALPELTPSLLQFRTDLAFSGYSPVFIETKLYAGEKHQDGRTLLALRRFIKDVRTSYTNLQGVILIGDFPEGMLVRRWIWRREADSDKNLIIGGQRKGDQTPYLRIVPEYVSHRADIVLADLDGNWENIYRETEDLDWIEAIPGPGVGADWPIHGQIFISTTFNFSRETFNDFFWIKDDRFTLFSQPGDQQLRLRVFTSLQHPEMTNSDKALPNPLARPEIFVSRINARHVAENPDLSYRDMDGKGYIDAEGKPRSVRSSSIIDLDEKVFWRRDPVLERWILIDYFQRNHDHRSRQYANLPLKAAAIAFPGSDFSAADLAAYLNRASSNFQPADTVENASLLDYVNWLKRPAVLRGIIAHSGPGSSDFNVNYLTGQLELAAGGNPWRWRYERNENGARKYSPSLARQIGRADLYLHRTIWENGVMVGSGPALYIHGGCEANSPAGAADMPYSHMDYATWQNAEGILFFLNGVALVARAKVFYDRPAGFTDALAASPQACFGDGWRAYFTTESQDQPLSAKPADCKRCYTWSILGDWSVRLRY
jgi:hypothetical protein